MSLIFALLNEKNWESVYALLAVNPNCVFEKDASGVEPLFYCLDNYEITAAILSKNPQTVKSKTSAGNLPLHVALSMGSAVPFSVIALLIKSFPMACQETNSFGNLPLHVLFQYYKSPAGARVCGGVARDSYDEMRKYFLDTMGLLLVHNAKAASVKNKDGKLPLHFAASKNVYVEAIQLLTETRRRGNGYIDAVWCKEQRNNSLPIHCAIAATALLYKEIGTPSAVSEETAATSEVVALEAEESPLKTNYLAVIELLLSLYPDSVYELDCRQNSPFILSIKYNAPVHVFTLLGTVQENMGREMISVSVGPNASTSTSAPTAAPQNRATGVLNSPAGFSNLKFVAAEPCSAPTMKLMFPIHYAVRFANVSAALVSYLITLFPDSVNYSESNEHYQSMRHQMGSFPLHMALENCCHYSVIEVLLRASPAIASIRNPDIKLCIHFAAWKQFPLAVVRALCEAFPEGVMRKEEKYGQLPIHYAIQYHCDLDVITYLLDQYPDGAKIGTKAGKLALHLACRYTSPLEVIQMLMKRFPEAAGMSDRSGRIPYDYLLEYEAPASVLKVLLGVAYEEVDWDEPVELHPSSLPVAELDAKSALIGRHMEEVETSSAAEMKDESMPGSTQEVGPRTDGDKDEGDVREDAGKNTKYLADTADINASKKKTFSSLFKRKTPDSTVCTYEKLIKQLTNRNQQMVSTTPGKSNKIYSGVNGAITWLQCEVVTLYRYIHQLHGQLKQHDEEVASLKEVAQTDADTIRKLNKTIATLQRNLEFVESQGQKIDPSHKEGAADGEFVCPSFGTDKASPAVLSVYDKKKRKDNFVQIIQAVVR